jgi:uncharacterized protein YsxB (DUF464 family)
MFAFVILEDKNGQALGFEARGHAGERKKGENLACAAASFLVQTLITGIKDEAELPLEVVRGKSGELFCRFAQEPLPAQRESIEFLLRVAERGFGDLGRMDKNAVIRVERKRDM